MYIFFAWIENDHRVVLLDHGHIRKSVHEYNIEEGFDPENLARHLTNNSLSKKLEEKTEEEKLKQMMNDFTAHGGVSNTISEFHQYLLKEGKTQK